MIPTEYIDIENETELDIDTEALYRQADFMFRRLRLHPETEVSIILVDEERMSQLHVEWMDEEGPTDVLSFPMDELRIPAEGEDGHPGILGDIALCPAFAARQAAEHGQTLAEELAGLVNLEYIYLGTNRLAQFPVVVCHLPRLEYLSVRR